MSWSGPNRIFKQTQKQACMRIKNLTIPQMDYRAEIGDRWFEDSVKLHS